MVGPLPPNPPHNYCLICRRDALRSRRKPSRYPRRRSGKVRRSSKPVRGTQVMIDTGNSESSVFAVNLLLFEN